LTHNALVLNLTLQHAWGETCRDSDQVVDFAIGAEQPPASS
jgi:hypothetical protein